MIGTVDESDRALLVIQVRPDESEAVSDISVWIDTAFTGELVMPRSTIESLGLTQAAGILAILADGTNVELPAYRCQVDWFGEWRWVEVIQNEGECPLLGVGLLRNRRLLVDYRARTINME